MSTRPSGARILRLVEGLAIVASGGLLFAASSQRWSQACPSDDYSSVACGEAQSGTQLLFPDGTGVVPPGTTLAGLTMLVLAFALVLLPWAITGRRPGPFTALALVAVVAAHVSVGVASVRAGMSGEPVAPYLGEATAQVWMLLTPLVVVRLAVCGLGWTRAAGILLFFGCPFVGLITYARGSYDAATWWEARIGFVTALAGLCLVVAALRRTPAPAAEESGAEVAVAATT